MNLGLFPNVGGFYRSSAAGLAALHLLYFCTVSALLVKTEPLPRDDELGLPLQTSPQGRRKEHPQVNLAVGCGLFLHSGVAANMTVSL